MAMIKKNLKASHDRQKSYAYMNIVFKYFKVGEHVFLIVKAKRSSLKLGSCPKLAANCGPFEILENIGPIAYTLAFLASIKVHNVFHVSLLKSTYLMLIMSLIGM
jgi:hypothetical protein